MIYTGGDDSIWGESGVSVAWVAVVRAAWACDGGGVFVAAWDWAGGFSHGFTCVWAVREGDAVLGEFGVWVVTRVDRVWDGIELGE